MIIAIVAMLALIAVTMPLAYAQILIPVDPPDTEPPEIDIGEIKIKTNEKNTCSGFDYTCGGKD